MKRGQKNIKKNKLLQTFRSKVKSFPRVCRGEAKWNGTVLQEKNTGEVGKVAKKRKEVGGFKNHALREMGEACLHGRNDEVCGGLWLQFA